MPVSLAGNHVHMSGSASVVTTCVCAPLSSDRRGLEEAAEGKDPPILWFVITASELCK